MKIISLKIETRGRWEDINPGRLVARVRYEEEQGAVEVLLNPEASDRLLEICAPFIGKYAQRASGEIAESLMKVALEAKKNLLDNPEEPATTTSHPQPVVNSYVDMTMDPVLAKEATGADCCVDAARGVTTPSWPREVLKSL